jgi:phytoene dehydrogenase-like protein
LSTAAIVGSGPNGLAAAVTLAAAGLDVTVYEASSSWGGGARSSELTTQGLLHDECSGFHPFAVSNEFTTFAGLERYGLEWAWADVEFSHPLDGGGASVHRSVAATARALGRDERAWRRLFVPLVARFDEIADDFLRPVVRLPRRPVALARFGARAVAPASALLRCFRTAEARALFAGVAAHAFWPFGSPLSSAIGVALNTAAHACGWPVAVGGSQRIADAMVAALHELGGRVETGRPVRALDELGSPTITMLDLAPAAAVDVAGARMAPRVVRALRRYRHGPGAFKVDFAVERGVPWRHEESRRAGTVHVGGDAREIAASEAAIQRGELPERPFVLVGQQYVADPSRSSGALHPVYAYAHVPAAYAGDATELIERNIERFAPGFRDRVVERHVRSTTALSVHNANYVGGDITTGANSPRQLVFRPRVALDPYRLAPGLYLCSAATPPGAGAHGMCGYLAARSALRVLGVRLPRRLGQGA